MEKTTRAFLKHVKEELKSQGFRANLKKARFIQLGDLKVNGYFCEEDKVLACAMGQPEDQWLPILVHEYSHFIQWRDKRKPYQLLYKHPLVKKYDTSIDNITLCWGTGEELPSGQTISMKDGREAINVSRDMELDCERVSIAVIEKYGLPLDIPLYCQKANAYVQFYNLIKDTKKWYTIGKEPYNIPEVLETMPDTLISDCKRLSSKARSILMKKCY